MLVGVPGKRLFAAGIASPLRGMINFNGILYSVQSNRLILTFANGTTSAVGTLGTSTGRVSMAQNGLLSRGIGGNQICIVDGVNGYIYNVNYNIWTPIPLGVLPDTPSHVEYIDGYFIITNGTMNAYASDLYDGLTWNPIATTPVQAAPDNVANLINLHEQLFFIKEYTTEVFYNNATATSLGFPFSRLSGTVIDYGTPAPWSVARGNGSIFFLANERDNNGPCFIGVVELNGYTPTPIAPQSIVNKMSKSADLSQCFGYTYSDEGHTFYVVTSPVDDWTFVYDATTQMWHERSTNNGADDHIHRDIANDYVRYNNMHVVGDGVTGNLYEVSSKFYTDAGIPIVSEQITQHVVDGNGLDDLFIDELQIDIEAGVGSNDVNVPAIGTSVITAGVVTMITITYNGADYITAPTVLISSVDGNGTGASATATVTYGSVTTVTVDHGGSGYTIAPTVTFISGEIIPAAGLSLSKDGGKTWGAESIRSMGKVGEYRKRLLWRSLGRCKDRVFRLRISSPVKRIIMGWYVDGSR
jgi:hypothetical protein